MKIKPEHFDHIRTEINRVLNSHSSIRPTLVEAYETGKFAGSDKVKDLQTRFNFDLFYAAGLTKWVCENVYSYANDSHIATALNAICPKVTRRY